jgi:hypothetical protein
MAPIEALELADEWLLVPEAQHAVSVRVLYLPDCLHAVLEYHPARLQRWPVSLRETGPSEQD